MLSTIKARLGRLRAYTLPIIISVGGGLVFIMAPVTIGLIALTPVVPILTGTALAIIAYRQYSAQSEVLKGN